MKTYSNSKTSTYSEQYLTFTSVNTRRQLRTSRCARTWSTTARRRVFRASRGNPCWYSISPDSRRLPSPCTPARLISLMSDSAHLMSMKLTSISFSATWWWRTKRGALSSSIKSLDRLPKSIRNTSTWWEDYCMSNTTSEISPERTFRSLRRMTIKHSKVFSKRVKKFNSSRSQLRTDCAIYSEKSSWSWE